jgi:U3 small nucleolar RNA-associated protein 20
LDLIYTALRRGRFDLHDPAIIARLESLVVAIGNTLYSNSAPVLTSGLKAVAEIVKCPLKSLPKSVPVFIRQIIDIIRQTGSTEPEMVQTAFKSLATILRDDPRAQVKEKDLVYLLELLSPDLEESSRQASVFTMLRAIVSRKFVVPEIYDIMDKVSEIMITSQSRSVQEQCRNILLQFLLDYPQGKGRLRNQMTFLAKNLSYVYESGRISAMELLRAIISKFDVRLIKEYSDLLFIALVMAIANDDSSKCRQMAAELIKSLFGRLDDDHHKLIIAHLHTWASQHSQPQLSRVSIQIYSLVVDVLKASSQPYFSVILGDLNAALEYSAQQLAIAEDEDRMQVDVEWQVPYHSLIGISKVLRVLSVSSTGADKINWSPIVGHLLFPHMWVRTASCRLLGLLFTDVPISPPRIDLPDTSPFSRHGMFDITKRLCLQLKSEHLDATLSLQIVKNLFYVGKCFSTMTSPPSLEVDNSGPGTPGEKAHEGQEGESGPEINPLPWLFSKLSYQIKSAHIARRNRTSDTVSYLFR